MKNNKSTKKALITSIVSMLTCLTMLIGTTFAWFTDTASTAVNKIEAGTLKIDIVDVAGNSLDGQSMSFVNKENEDDILWEPGVTFRTTGFKIKSTGKLALKYKLALNGVEGNTGLINVIEFSIVKNNNEVVPLDTFEGHLTPQNTESDVYYIQGHMDELANNTYQGLTLTGLGITVYATQDAVESDSNGTDYDDDATYPEYPLGITAESFGESEKVVDANGNFYTSFKDAVEGATNESSLYVKENETIDFPTHLNMTKSLTIYGNGADFSGKDLSIGTYRAPENGEVTINIYNAKNLVVWGQPADNRVDVWNINFVNCVNDGYNLLMYRGNENSSSKINLTLTNCKASGYSDSIVHTTADGTINVKNCTFSNNCAPINISHKQSGSMEIAVENSTFTNCGKIDPDNDYFAPARFVNNSSTGSLTVNLTNNTFSRTIGTNGDILLGDYRTGKASNALTANITTQNPVMVKSSSDAPYSYAGGTITLN